ncbi:MULTISPECIES: C1 family peptidase [Legionella]|uniref:C1 family peptidase n=1 Tax=Legionella TaxID=445 RepID=UPI000F8F6531|nr:MULTISPECIES: C1 family peptidase [Legionella]MCP0914629.1 C1 family peptidase [Legionella sp. 27cVA30]RUQ99368.1 peptidase C1 [Legionella septentrionalis]RUR12979.1 peptidase C1 [Legionella septentrionalis]
MNRINVLFFSLKVIVCLVLLTPLANAEDVELIGSLNQTLKIHASGNQLEQDSRGLELTEKTIKLLHVRLAEDKKAELKSQAQDLNKHRNGFTSSNRAAASLELPKAVSLNMNNVPVLDQGTHGTCVTFAVSGGLDAVIGKGDYISQLCQLQLGNYLEQHGYGISGWDGSFSGEVFGQMAQYGVINVDNQWKNGCGGYYDYPKYSKRPQTYIAPEDFAKMSEPVLGTYAAIKDIRVARNFEATLDNVKNALHAGDRVVFGVLLPRVDLGTAGAVGKYRTWFTQDTWVLSKEVMDGISDIEAAHEMIITGYDDNATVYDDHGVAHKGLLTLRNSWGTSVGYWGEFYMSYDYFKLLNLEVTEILPINH